MQIEFASNASFIIRLKTGKTLLTDPWYSDGIYYGAWYNCPPIPPARRDALLKLTPDYIYISHIHPDHLDGATLAHYPRSTPILIGRFSEPGFRHLKRALAALGFTDIRVLELWAPTELDGAQVAILPQFAACNAAESSGDTDFEMDTSLWVRDVDGASVLNVVDNALHDAAAQEIWTVSVARTSPSCLKPGAASSRRAAPPTPTRRRRLGATASAPAASTASCATPGSWTRR